MRSTIRSWKLPLACAGIVIIVATHGVLSALPAALPTSNVFGISTGGAVKSGFGK